MSLSFQIRYFLGLIPKAQKIDSSWAELFKMRDELYAIEASPELARYRELKLLVQSNDFQTKKREINNLSLKNSDEYHLLKELATLENLKPIKNYFRYVQSADFEKVNLISKSSDLTRYHELKKIVQSPDFIHREKETKGLRYKGSPEHLKRQEFNTLNKSVRLKHYRDTLESEEYHVFLKLDAADKGKSVNLQEEDKKVKIYRHFLRSKAYQNLLIVEKHDLPGKLEQLKKETSSPHFLEQEAFLMNRNRYTTTPDYPLFTEFETLSRSSDIRFYLKCINSSIFANYKEIVISAALARLQELSLAVMDQEFQQRVEFLKNKKRFELTPEFKLEKELDELERSKLITTYHQLLKRSELSFFNQWEIVLDENFSEHQLSTTLWEPENYWGSKIAGFSFSQAAELQAFNGLNNIEIKNQVLSIVTKAEKSEGKVWDPAYGLIPKEFEYSSAILNTGNSFKFREGVVEAKVKFRAEAAITSALSLTGSRPFPQIDVFRSGHKRVGLGIIEHPANGGIKKLTQVKGLNFNNFHIFRLEIFGDMLIWKINNHEVHREKYAQNSEELFLNFIGTIHLPISAQSLPHYFEIDWVRCLQKKNAEPSATQ